MNKPKQGQNPNFKEKEKEKEKGKGNNNFKEEEKATNPAFQYIRTTRITLEGEGKGGGKKCDYSKKSCDDDDDDDDNEKMQDAWFDVAAIKKQLGKAKSNKSRIALKTRLAEAKRYHKRKSKHSNSKHAGGPKVKRVFGQGPATNSKNAAHRWGRSVQVRGRDRPKSHLEQIVDLFEPPANRLARQGNLARPNFYWLQYQKGNL